jgi:hypothetical protein
VTLHQDEVVTLRRRLQQADNEVIALKQSLTGSIASAAAASSESSGSNSSAALKLVIDVLHRDIEILRDRVTAADRAAASAHMASIVHMSSARAASAVAAALPAPQRRLLQACATVQCELDLQVDRFSHRTLFAIACHSHPLLTPPQLLVLDWMFLSVCSRFHALGKKEGLELAVAVISCIQAVHDAHALLCGLSSCKTSDIDEAVVCSAEDVCQTTLTLRK